MSGSTVGTQPQMPVGTAYTMFSDSPIQFFVSRYAIALIVMVRSMLIAGDYHEPHSACMYAVRPPGTNFPSGACAAPHPCDPHAVVCVVRSCAGAVRRHTHRVGPSVARIRAPVRACIHQAGPIGLAAVDRVPCRMCRAVRRHRSALTGTDVRRHPGKTDAARRTMTPRHLIWWDLHSFCISIRTHATSRQTHTSISS